ncbi:MAG: hypothetical protein U1E51_06675 [Candidatus Binatia bacterium]|nr:hypothetical protein [Candidatus Binatia bacterium]
MDLRSAAEAVSKVDTNYIGYGVWKNTLSRAELHQLLLGISSKIDNLRAALAQPDKGAKLAEMVLEYAAKNRRGPPARIVEQARKVKGG